MNLAGMRLRGQTPWFDDPPVAAYALLRDVLTTCKRHAVDPVGTLDVAIVEHRFTDDQALRWEFTPTPDGGPRRADVSDLPCPSIPRVLASLDLERRLGVPVSLDPTVPLNVIVLMQDGKALDSFTVADPPSDAP